MHTMDKTTKDINQNVLYDSDPPLHKKVSDGEGPKSQSYGAHMELVLIMYMCI
jgi:hypothetical protein